MSVWLAPCGADCSTVDVNSVGWFKIREAGLLSGDLVEEVWYQKQFQRWNGSPALWPVVLPRELKSGLHLIRHEISSIHVEDKPQFYPECAHLNVTGGGGLVVLEELTVRFPGVYEEDGQFSQISVSKHVQQSQRRHKNEM